jgi:AraC family transcriptional regulator, ethanolamine operon transcriptional activator
MSSTPPLRAMRITDDLQEIEALDRAAQWETNFYHFENGGMEASFRLLQSDEFQLVENTFNIGVLIRGEIPAGTVVFAAASAPGQSYLGKRLTQRDIVLISGEDEIEYRCRGSSRILTAAIAEEILSQAMEVRWGMTIETLRQSKLLPLGVGMSNIQLQEELNSFLSPGITDLPVNGLSPDERLLDLFFKYVMPPDGSETSDAYVYAYRHKLAHKVEEYLRMHFDMPISMTTLCHEFNARERTIRQGFRERYDMSPYAYVKTLRMDAARKALLSASPNDSVTGIALDAGFTHMGRFSVDYKNSFGELPSTTLSRSSGSVAYSWVFRKPHMVVCR